MFIKVKIGDFLTIFKINMIFLFKSFIFLELLIKKLLIIYLISKIQKKNSLDDDDNPKNISKNAGYLSFHYERFMSN